MRPAVPPIVRRLGWVSFFTDIAAEMIYPLIPTLLRSFGTAAIWLGVMEGIAEAASALVKWRIGPVVDRSPRRKPFIVAGYALATLARPLVAFATMGLHVVVLRSLDRIGKGVRGVPRDALVADSVPRESLATAFAFHRMMDNAGSVLGPIVAFALLRMLELPARTVILCAFVPGLVSLLVLVLGVKEEPVAKAAPKGSPERSGGADASESAGEGQKEARERLPSDLRTYLAVLGLFTLGSSADSFLLLRAPDVGVPTEWVPLLWLSLSLAKTASNLPGGWLADRIGYKPTLVAGWLLYAAFYGALPFVTTPVPFAIVVVAYGAYYGLAEGSERALLTALAPPAMKGRAFGAMHAITGIAVLPANLLFGFLYGKDVTLAFGASAACAGAAALLLALVVKKPATLTP
ncbi:MAG: MFS transporter [Deltaproteobacteria bacterium]|nr:MFS transporter [Deltaproteobacteria bacterium]